MNTIDFLLNLLYPPKCLVCGELLWPSSTSPLCDKCLEEWNRLKRSKCRECKRPHRDCHCVSPILRDMKVVGTHMVPYSQDTVAGQLLLIAKDERLPVLTNFFADELGPVLEPIFETTDHSDILITYLPRSRRRAAVSGIDQGRALAKAIGKQWDIPVVSMFRRRGSTAQKDLANAEERMRAARRSYRLRKHIPDLGGKTVLLIDDIYTTGATMIAGAELLQSKGAGKIHCVTVGKTEKSASKKQSGRNKK